LLTVAQVFALADAFTDRRYRLLVLLAVFCSLRWGERAALPRYCVETDAGIIAVRVSVVELARAPSPALARMRHPSLGGSSSRVGHPPGFNTD
jgi:hypothetical protein